MNKSKRFKGPILHRRLQLLALISRKSSGVRDLLG